jgi:adenine/guanine phosphoribosyltransferase-like PRPP-binding protein
VSHADPPAGSGSAGREAAKPRSILDDTAIRRALVRIAHEIVERNPEPEKLYLVAIPNGGVPLARILAGHLGEIADLEVRRCPRRSTTAWWCSWTTW